MGLTNANVISALNLTPPDDTVGCWDYGLAADGAAGQLQLLATGDNTPTKCSPVNTATVTLTLNGDASASQSEVLP